ncbi:MAG: hypothetical protein ACTSVB_07235 [Candidatus Heimdallarchaeaceae archaeon]|uniref:Uncharacterized protein n=1 Tax=Candidatus Heimdallarchaeum endolithica TaxID=2876572 RepID=A0A9Y1FPX3_9ARCH|nr:MAG: hypothetical protein K9W46_03705 [Candidatus Heimdallarchaeum endolithica]
MEEISVKEYLEKSGQLLEKYRFNIENLRHQRKQIEDKFFLPNEMVDFFHTNKSEYKVWSKIQDMILTLEDAYADLVGSMMEAKANPENYNFYLEDKRITIMQLKETEEDES